MHSYSTVVELKLGSCLANLSLASLSSLRTFGQAFSTQPPAMIGTHSIAPNFNSRFILFSFSA